MPTLLRVSVFFAIWAMLSLPNFTFAHGSHHHESTGNKATTLAFYDKSLEVTFLLHQRVLPSYFEGDDLLERGIIAEMKGAKQPELFRQALSKFEESANAADLLDIRIQELVKVVAESGTAPGFAEALALLVTEHAPVERISNLNSRYSLEGQGFTPPQEIGKSLSEMLNNEKGDLGILRGKIRNMITALRASLPNADRGDFEVLMLSGRSGFADMYQDTTYLVSVFENSFNQNCLITVRATMQAYPKGLEWIKDSAPSGRTRS